MQNGRNDGKNMLSRGWTNGGWHCNVAILSLAVYFVNGSKKAVPEPENCEAVGTMPTEVVETAYALLELEIRYDTHYLHSRSDARFALKLCVF